MADQKISDMTSASTFNDADVFPLVQSNTNKKGAWSLFKSVLKTYFDTLYLALSGGTMTGNIAMGTNKITGLGAASANGDAVSYEQVVGVQDLYVPASAFSPRETSGCNVLTRREMATSLVNIMSLNFDGTNQEFAQWSIILPRKYNLGTFTYEIVWTAASGSGTTDWGVSGAAYSNDDSLTGALGSAVTVNDTLTAVDDLCKTPTSGAVTLGGTPASADLIVIQIARNPGSDTLAVDAEFVGIHIHITTNAAIDA